jgi:hypothetical protein
LKALTPRAVKIKPVESKAKQSIVNKQLQNQQGSQCAAQ